VGAVTAAKNQVTAGDIGFAYVIRALSQAGRGDVIYSMLKQSTGPGYLDQIKNGATSLTGSPGTPTRPTRRTTRCWGHCENGCTTAWAASIPTRPARVSRSSSFARSLRPALFRSDAEYHSIRGLIVSTGSKAPPGLRCRSRSR